MRVNIYNTFHNENGLSILIKEKSFNYPKTEKLNSATVVTQLMNDIFSIHMRDTEYVYLISMNTNGRPIGFFELSHGTVNQSLMSPREIIIKALLSNAVNIIIVHNHPSGCYAPSNEDICVTRKITEALNLVGLKLLDHIIISCEGYYSFAEHDAL